MKYPSPLLGKKDYNSLLCERRSLQEILYLVSGECNNFFLPKKHQWE